MKKFRPIAIVLVFLMISGLIIVYKKKQQVIAAKITTTVKTQDSIGTFNVQKSCVRLPSFLKELHIPQPVMIDLSQQHYKGIALLYGKQMQKALHPKAWEQYDAFSTYTLDNKGNIFLVPMPYISIKPTTFNLQKNIYKLDGRTGKIEIFMHFDDVQPSASNPYGINAIAYDCEDNTLWVSAIDETDYQTQHGVIYHIDIQTKEILSRIEGIDVLTLTLLKNKKSKYLLAGGARINVLYAFDLKGYQKENTPIDFKPKVLFSLPSPNEYIRKIKIKGLNHLELQTIPFSYTLIAQSTKKDRIFYDLYWNTKIKDWLLKQHN